MKTTEIALIAATSRGRNSPTSAVPSAPIRTARSSRGGSGEYGYQVVES